MFITNNETIQQGKVYQQMFEALPIPVTLTDRSGIIKYGNKAFFGLTGREPGQIIDKLINHLFPVNLLSHEYKSLEPAQTRDLSIERCDCDASDLFQLLIERSGQPITEANEFRLSLPGYYGPLKVHATNLSDFVCFTFIVTGHKIEPASVDIDQEVQGNVSQTEDFEEKLEEMVQQNRDLSRSNQDLSQYAYVASHDLQEPLRKIRIFSDILIGSPQLSGKEKFIANKINIASERMSLLIKDLLNYSKLLKSDAVFEEVDLQEVLKAVMIDFEVRIQEKKAMVICPDLPRIQGVKLQVNQLFYNLLGNALKFTVPGQEPRIEITVKESESSEVREFIARPQPGIVYLHIKFSDNGIGFATKDAELIFEVFKRLYPRQVYEGSGIGLALCRRIVQNHCGSLYATSEPGNGSVFNIILPITQPLQKAKKKGQNENSAPL